MMRASACLDYALLWFALWWDLFGESIRESDVIPKRRAGDGWIERRPAQPGLLQPRYPIVPRSGIRHSGACHGAGAGRVGDRFRPDRLGQSRIRQCRQHFLVRRAFRPGFGSPFAGHQLPVASRRPFGAFEFRYGVRAHRKPVGRTIARGAERSVRAVRLDRRGGNPAAKSPAGPGQSSVCEKRPGVGFF